MATGWQDLYQVALREQDSTSVTDACEQARRAIHDQFIALARQDCPHSWTAEELDEALRQLLIHEARLRGERRFPSTLANPLGPDANSGRKANAR